MYKQAEIEQWGIDRDLYKESNFEAQFEKLLEEHGELYRDTRNDDINAIKDAIGDNYVVLRHLAVPTLKRKIVKNDSALRLISMALAVAYTDVFQCRDKDSIDNAIGTLKLICSVLDISFEDCIDGAVATISTRTGRFINGVYVKDQK